MKPRGWYRFQNAAAESPTSAELFIYDYIGKSWWNDDAVSAKQFVDDLNALPASVTNLRTRVNSPGGSVFDAVAIANAMRTWAKDGRTVETQIDGLAASAASIVIMAGTAIRIGDNAMVMVHNPLTIALGNAKEFRKIADDLDAVRGSILATYRWHSKLSNDDLIALMDAETWMDADEAVSKGFATEKVEGLKVAASVDLHGLELKVPDRFRARVSALVAAAADPTPVPAAADELIRLCAEASLDLSFAQTLIHAKVTAADAKTRIAAEKDTRAKAETRRTEITALCTRHGLAEAAPSYINGGMTLEAVKAQLVIITAKIDGKTSINTDLNSGGAAAPALNIFDDYARLNGKKE